MKLLRWLNKIYADLFGYFWLPCRVCGTHFGGHEWKDENTIWFNQYEGEGVCSKQCVELWRLRNERNKKKL